MKRVLLITIVLALLSVGLIPASPGPPGSVPVRVTIENFLSDGVTPTQVHDDGNGEYVDGVGGVNAELGSGFVANFWPGRGTPTRNIYFNHQFVPGQFYSGPLPGSPFLGGQIPLTGWG